MVLFVKLLVLRILLKAVTFRFCTFGALGFWHSTHALLIKPLARSYISGHIYANWMTLFSPSCFKNLSYTQLCLLWWKCCIPGKMFGGQQYKVVRRNLFRGLQTVLYTVEILRYLTPLCLTKIPGISGGLTCLITKSNKFIIQLLQIYHCYIWKPQKLLELWAIDCLKLCLSGQSGIHF